MIFLSAYENGMKGKETDGNGSGRKTEAEGKRKRKENGFWNGFFTYFSGSP